MTAAGKRIRPFLKIIYVLCVLVSMAWALSGAEMDLFQALSLLLVPQSVLFVGVWILMVFFLGLLWRTWLQQAEGVCLRASEWIPAQMMGWAGRYLPGKVGLFMGKLAMVRRHQVGVRALLLSVVVEQLGFVIAGACVALILFSPGMLEAWTWLPTGIVNAWGWWMPAAVLFAVSAMGAGVVVSAQVLGCRAALSKAMHAVGLLILHAGPHLIIGLTFYLLAAELFPHVKSFPITHFVAVMALAHVAGILAVFAPAGFGVREVVLAEGLRGVLLFDEALMLAAVLRVLTLVADGVVVFATVTALRWWSNGKD